VVTPQHTEPARLPPPDLDGLDPSWSRLVRVPATDGVGRTWHLLDNGVANPRLTLLCVHGNPSWSYLFRDLLARAPRDVRVVAVDQLDMGWSERTGTVRRLATRVDDLCQLTDELALAGPVVTVAHDWGGPISLGWAERHADRLAGVVLMNTAVHQPEGSPAPSLIRLARSKPLLRNVTVRTTTFIRGAYGMSRPRPPQGVRRALLAPYATAPRRAAIAEFVGDIPLDPSHPSWPALRSIADGLDALAQVPVLLVWGAADQVFSDLYLHDLERRLPHASVHRFPKAAHFVMEDADAAGVVVDWLGTLGDDAGSAPSAGPGPESSTLGDVHGELGDKPAIVEMTGERPSVTFAELDALVADTAAGLAGVGVRPGDRVALMIPPGIDLAAVLYGCWRAGAVVVLIDSGLGPRGMSAAIRVADPRFLVGIPRAIAAARVLGWPGRRIATGDLAALRSRPGPLPPAPTRDQPAAVVFTSGATGPSKGVRYSHAQLGAQRDALVRLYGITTDDRLVAAFAPFALYGPAMGITSVVPDMDVAAPATLTAAALGDAAVAVDATLVFASPAALANVVRTADGLTPAHRAAFAGVRTLMSAGAPVRPTLLRSARDLFPGSSTHTPYGMTECLPVASIELAEIESIAAGGDTGGTGDGVCVGFPVPEVDVRVRALDAIGRPHGDLVDTAGVVGEVHVRAAHMRSGYDRLWHTEARASHPAGWHATGDVGHLDHRRRLWIGGRLGHVITTADGPVAPVRFELAVDAVTGIDSSAVVGVGPVGNQQLVAVVQPTDPPRRAREADAARVDLVRTAVRSATGRDVVAVLEVPALPVDRRHNSKIDRTRVAAWAEQVLAGRRPGKL
jgi:acyl-CoA synthetase (AMP-forming)/AMP-acid ligase II/pimeloyl-ACP methyl ester carboxylesterase